MIKQNPDRIVLTFRGDITAPGEPNRDAALYVDRTLGGHISVLYLHKGYAVKMAKEILRITKEKV